AKAKYLDTGKCSPEVLGYYPDAFWLKARRGRPSSCCLGNRDFIIAEKGFCFDLSPWEDEAPNDDPLQRPGTDAETLTLILDACNRRTEGKKPIMVCGFLPWDIKYSAEAGGRHQVVEGEWKLAETLSLRNAYMDADAVNYAGMCNASFFSKEPLKKYYPQKARGRDGAVLEDKCYVCFYAGDYDSAAWMYQNLPALWNDPERGKEPMCWGFDPNLARRFAAGFAYIRRTAASADYFVGGDSGAGYINPGFLAAPRASGLPSGTEAWKKHCLRLYRQFGLSVTGFLLEGNAPPMAPEVWEALREFSPGGAAGMYMPETGLYKDMPFVRIQYDLIRFDKTKKEEYVREFVRLSREKSPCFILARHILWSPSEQKEFMEALKEAGDFEQTDIFTFMGLVKQFEEGGGVYRPKDLFDCRRITVESHSPLFDGCDARDAFGGRFGTRENGGILFADTGEDEYTLEWSAAEAPEHVSVTLEADGSGERQAEKAVLLGDAGDGFFAVVSASPEEYGRVTLEGDAKGARRFRLILTKRKENRLAPRIKHISAWRDR
ncbi:MAG: hypothetical protein ILO36_06560, partial [Abditibacteriota bacterium]|nr:hypothetical protein [Abditibacteriota bacterium]